MSVKNNIVLADTVSRGYSFADTSIHISQLGLVQTFLFYLRPNPSTGLGVSHRLSRFFIAFHRISSQSRHISESINKNSSVIYILSFVFIDT
jgi:hypothetical protein